MNRTNSTDQFSQFISLGASKPEFIDMVEKICKQTETDKELFDGIQILDMEAQQSGKTLYEIAFKCLYNAQISLSSKQWLQNNGVRKF